MFYKNVLKYYVLGFATCLMLLIMVYPDMMNNLTGTQFVDILLTYNLLRIVTGFMVTPVEFALNKFLERKEDGKDKRLG